MSKLTLLLVTWNGIQYLPHVFDALTKQTYQDWDIHVLDNGSHDETLAYLSSIARDMGRRMTVDVVERNVGFARAYNALFRKAKSEYICILNQDLSIEETCLERLMRAVEEGDIDVVAPRLMRWHFSLVTQGDFDHVYSDFIDAIGIEELPSSRVLEKYTGVKWSSIDSMFMGDVEPVWGVSGTMFLASRSVLRSVCYAKEELFDELYFAYKEDIDLMKRLRLAKKRIAVVLTAVAYHDRSGSAPQGMTDIHAAENKRTQNELIKMLSYQNHLKNLYKYGWLRPQIIWYELKKFVWYLRYDRQILSGWGDVWAQRKQLQEKKYAIKRGTKKI